MRHRGPDAEGFFLDQELALAHRRLSIIDLSKQLTNPSLILRDRYIIVFNGEIYNYAEVKSRFMTIHFVQMGIPKSFWPGISNGDPNP